MTLTFVFYEKAFYSNISRIQMDWLVFKNSPCLISHFVTRACLNNIYNSSWVWANTCLLFGLWQTIVPNKITFLKKNVIWIFSPLQKLFTVIVVKYNKIKVRCSVHWTFNNHSYDICFIIQGIQYIPQIMHTCLFYRNFSNLF